MEKYPLGKTGLKVSGLCFGALPMGPLQAGLSVEDGGALILQGLERGINFIDTAEGYRTYPHIRWALDRFSGDVVIASKSTAATYPGMRQSVEQALNELGRSTLEIFHLHSARIHNPLTDRAEALQALLELKNKGVIRAIGVSSHSVTAILEAAMDPRIDIVFPLINRTGLGILDGGVLEMRAAIAKAILCQKGTYAMKAFGGGNLLTDLQTNLEFVRREVGVPVVAVGMVRPVELEINLALFENRPVSPELLEEACQYRKRAQVVASLCKGCGRCSEFCHSSAIQISDGYAKIDDSRCLLCGYCSRECPQFAIRVV
ncbi:MAG TPA: aldo/keto reductase [Bacillota bacterium]|nr:aldo/keto reductase [Bacillota bacterium]